MNAQNRLSHAALCLADPWFVAGSELTETEDPSAPSPGADGRAGTLRSLQIDIDFKQRARFACPECGACCPVHDTTIKNWRHLDFWQYRTFLSARVPRVHCPEHGVRLVGDLPWARKGSGFTLLFEAFVMELCRVMPVNSAAGIVGEHDTRLWRIIHHYVEQAHSRQDWSGLDTLGVDETSTRKGHRYATAFVDLTRLREDGARLLWLEEGKDAATMGRFKEQMPAHDAQAQAVRSIAIDMSAAFKKGAADHFPDAALTFDRWHVMKLTGDAVDQVRRNLQRELGAGAATELKGSLWSLRGNEENLSPSRLETRRDLCRRHRKIARALALREHLQQTWELPDAAAAECHLTHWMNWARRSRLRPFVALTRTIAAHFEGILNFYPNALTSAAMESINNLLQTARRRARGYRNFRNLRAIAYWIAGHLDLRLPTHSF